jgi:multisubunit Na+/H+ antiporter MnhF subunit
MNSWLIAAGALLCGLIPCGAVVLTGRLEDRFVALQLCGLVTTIDLVLIAVGLGQPSFTDLALALVLLSAPGTLLYTQFLERWL